MLFLTVVLFAAVLPASAKPTTAHQAQAVVAAWLKLDASPLQAPMGRYVKDIQTYYDESGAASYYVVYLEPEGFVIVSADDLIEPIVAFASSGVYDTSSDNCLAALVTSDMADRIAEARDMEARVIRDTKAGQPDRLTQARNKWAQLTGAATAGVDTGIPSVSDVRVAPFVQTRWSQTTVCGGAACYNYYVPPGAAGSGNNYPCGCVATALAQVLRFFQHPTAGVGTKSFSILVDGVPQTRSLRGGNGTGGPYDWANMVLAPGSSCGTITEAQRQAIGALCHDAGVAVNMMYAPDGSGAYTHDNAVALKNTFMYSHARQGNNGASNIGASLNTMINPNLDAGYPVMLGIRGSAAGHAIVADGYGYNASTLYHHLNLGWGGSSDAWYNLPTVDAGSYSFTTVHTCVYNIYVTGTGEIISGRVADSFGVPRSGATVTATKTGGGTYTATTNAQGIYALAKVPSASTFTVSVHKEGYAFQSKSVSTGTTKDMTTICGNKYGVDFAAEAGFILTDINALTVSEGGMAVFKVKLNSPPSGNTTVAVARASGDSDISVKTGSTLTFNSSNWDTYQQVTVAAAQDADALDTSAVIRCSADGWLSADVTITEYDDDGQTVKHMKTRSEGSAVHCSRTAVTAVFGEFFYIEDDDRSCGIMVHKSDHGLTVGTRAGIEGVIQTASNGERFIEATTIITGGSHTIEPVGLSTSALGGCDLRDGVTQAGQSGVDGGTGPNNIGLLVRTWGKVSYTGGNYEMGWTFDTNPGWSVQGQWAFGTPTGEGGTLHGYPDPASGHTGSNVYGVNLNGDYNTTIGGPYYLTTTPINMSGCNTVTLSYWRWLNADRQNYAIETVAVSNNGTNWTQLWSNSTSETKDSSWVQQTFDITSVAANQPSVYIRWGHETRMGVWAFSGWNIDDVILTGHGQTAVIDDGSGNGVKLAIPAGVNMPPEGAYVAVTGISCCEKDGQNKIRRLLKVRYPSDINRIQ